MTAHVITTERRRLDEPTVIHTTSASWHVSSLVRLVCSCGWESPERPDAPMLRLDKHRHLVAVGERTQRRRSSRPRDGRKSKVYAAERAAFGARQAEQVWSSSAEAQRVLDEWIGTAWWQARFGPERIDVISRTNGSSTGSTSHRLINLARIHWNPIVLAHEAAHVVQPRGTAGHGKEWASIYLSLLERFVADADADMLRAAFVASKIPHRYAVKPTRTVETKAAKSAERKRRDAAVRARLLGEGADAAEVVRAFVAEGVFGPAGSKRRRAALDVAREIEGGRR